MKQYNYYGNNRNAVFNAKGQSTEMQDAMWEELEEVYAKAQAYDAIENDYKRFDHEVISGKTLMDAIKRKIRVVEKRLLELKEV